VGVRAAELPEQLVLLRSLDAFGDGLEVEHSRQFDDRGDELAVAVGAVGGVDEALVDLELIGRQPADVAERGIAAAEIVERDPYAQRPQRLESRDRQPDLLDQETFSDLEPDLAGVVAQCGCAHAHRPATTILVAQEDERLALLTVATAYPPRTCARSLTAGRRSCPRP